MRIHCRFIYIILTIFVISSVIDIVDGYGGISESSGGIFISSLEPHSNIIAYETREGDLITNQSIEYSFSSPEFSIYKVIVNGKNNEYDIPVRVEDLRNTSRLVNRSAPGIIYKNENVWIGTKKINYIAIRFKVINSWMKDNDLNESRIVYLLKWTNNGWLVLKTNMIGKDGIYTYFESPKVGSSYVSIFAISTPPKTTNRIDHTALNQNNYQEIDPEIEEVEYIKEDIGKTVLGLGMIIMILIIAVIIIYQKDTRKR